MDKETEKVRIIKYSEGIRSNIDDLVVKESPLTIILNNQELVTLLCTPSNMKYLAVGFLFSEGLLESKDDISRITVNDRGGVVHVDTVAEKAAATESIFKRLITSGCGRGASFYSAVDVKNQVKIDSRIKISASQALSLMRDFQHRSQVYRATGGVHSAALCENSDILVFDEDIGRHNAIDKIFGKCVLEGIPTDDRIVVSSGRISSEILLKVAKRNIPVLISKAAPTDTGVKLADDLGITVLGFVRGKRLNIYANDWRIVADGG
ncbi:formate dehydrogenase accessory sulfurtransferase FdhD [Chloroflexota bacterium]